MDQSVEFRPDHRSGEQKSSYSLKKEQPNRWAEIETLIRSSKNLVELVDNKESLREEAKTWPAAWREAFNDMYITMQNELY